MSVYVTSLSFGRGNSLLSASLALAIQVRGNSAVAVTKPFSVGVADSPRDMDLEQLAALSVPVIQDQLVVEGTGGFVSDHSEAVQSLAGRIKNYSGTVIMDGLPIGDIGIGDVSRALLVQIAKSTNSQVIGIIDACLDLDSWLVYKDIAQELDELFVGVILNKVPRYRDHWIQSELIPRMRLEGLEVLSVIAESRTLAGVSVSQLAELVRGELTHGQEYEEKLVKHLMLGVNVMDSSVPYYQQRQNKAVIVRGDRPDLQMGALATDTACLVLTGDKRPVQYVEYEADKLEVPIICTAHGTSDVAALLSGWPQLGAFGHAEKVEEFLSLLDQDLLLKRIASR
jgi:hypothetical protein